MTVQHDMKELLEKSKDEIISAASLIGIDDADIYIADSLDIIPSGATFPCIGIKDGDIERIRYVNCHDVLMDLHIAIYQLLKSGEDALMATQPTTLGILDTVAEIRNLMDDNFLDVSGVYMMDLPSEEETTLLDAGELAVVRKTITYRYYKRVNNA